jgi:hypothetical protein
MQIAITQNLDICYERCVSKPPKSYHLKILPCAFRVCEEDWVLASYPQVRIFHPQLNSCLNTSKNLKEGVYL